MNFRQTDWSACWTCTHWGPGLVRLEGHPQGLPTASCAVHMLADAWQRRALRMTGASRRNTVASCAWSGVATKVLTLTGGLQSPALVMYHMNARACTDLQQSVVRILRAPPSSICMHNIHAASAAPVRAGTCAAAPARRAAAAASRCRSAAPPARPAVDEPAAVAAAATLPPATSASVSLPKRPPAQRTGIRASVLTVTCIMTVSRQDSLGLHAAARHSASVAACAAACGTPTLQPSMCHMGQVF
jgi:hypothetical protein